MVEIQTKKLADVYKALSNENRIKILQYCEDKELSVTELSSKLKISYTLTSEYITILEKQGLVKKTKKSDNKVKVKSLTHFKQNGELEILTPRM